MSTVVKLKKGFPIYTRLGASLPIILLLTRDIQLKNNFDALTNQPLVQAGINLRVLRPPTPHISKLCRNS